MWAVLDLVLFICLSWSVHVCGVAFYLLKYPQTYVHVFFTSFLCCPPNGTCLTLTLNLSQILTGILLFTHFCLMTQYYVRVTSLPRFTIFLVNSSRTPSFTLWRRHGHTNTQTYTQTWHSSITITILFFWVDIIPLISVSFHPSTSLIKRDKAMPSAIFITIKYAHRRAHTYTFACVTVASAVLITMKHT